MKWIVLVCVVVASYAARVATAQVGFVAGHVSDASGLPIPGASVVIEEPWKGTASRSDGAFQIEDVPAGDRWLRVSSVGFRTKRVLVTIVPGQVTRVDLQLDEETLESSEIVVTAVRRPQATALVPVSVSVLTGDDLRQRNVRTLDDALRLVPGVQMAENQVNVRGSSGFSYNVGSRVLLLVDGVPLLGPETGGIPFDALPMPQVARIEVVKGPGSALYGSGALGGVINVITKAFPDRPETSLSGFVGAHDPVRHASWRARWPDGDAYRELWGLSATHARRFGRVAGGWIHVAYRTDAGYLRLAADETFQAYTKFGWSPSQSVSLSLLGGITARERDSFLYWDGLDNVLNPGRLDLLSPGGSDETGSNDNRSIQLSILPSIRHTLSTRVSHQLRLRYFLVQIRPIDEFGNSRPLEAGTSGFRFGGEWQVDWQPDARTFLSAGISGDANAARSSFFLDRDHGYAIAQPELAAFAQVERRLSERLTTLVGARLDAYQVDTTETTARIGPKLTVSYEATPVLTFRGSFGQGFRVPGLAERYVDNQDFFPFFPNHRLKPELSTGYELGVRLAKSGDVIPFAVDLAVFWNEYRRLVEPSFVTDPEGVGTLRPGFQFINLTRARIRGAEVVLDGQLRPAIEYQLGYTFLDARDLSSEEPLVFRSKHLLKTSIAATLWRRLSSGLDYRIASRPERVDSDFARFVPDADVMVASHVVDVRIAYRRGPLTLAGQVLNLLDFYYVERPAYLAPPRRYVLQMRADF